MKTLNIDSRRQTGRTTRMIEEAKRLAANGRAVYVITATHVEADRVSRLLGPDKMGIKVETPETIGNFNWRTMRPPGMHSNCEVLVDHFVIEREFTAIIDMLYRWDEPSHRWDGHQWVKVEQGDESGFLPGK